jgi:hypothetical protein
MMQLTKSAVVALAALVWLSTRLLAQTVGGDYRIDGAFLTEAIDSGAAPIEITRTTTWGISWETGTSASGNCMNHDNAFAAACAFENGAAGLVDYEILRDGTLDGRWTIADTAAAGSETLTPLRQGSGFT